MKNYQKHKANWSSWTETNTKEQIEQKQTRENIKMNEKKRDVQPEHHQISRLSLIEWSEKPSISFVSDSIDPFRASSHLIWNKFESKCQHCFHYKTGVIEWNQIRKEEAISRNITRERKNRTNEKMRDA